MSKTCKVMAAKQCLRPLPSLRPIQASLKQTGKEDNLELNGGSSIEFLREKAELEFETFLYSYHGLILHLQIGKRRA